MFRRGVDPALIVILAGVAAALHVGKLPPALPVLRDVFALTLVEQVSCCRWFQFAGMTLGLVVGLAAGSWGLRRCMMSGPRHPQRRQHARRFCPRCGGSAHPPRIRGSRPAACRDACASSDPPSRVESKQRHDARAVGAYMPFGTAAALLASPVAPAPLRLAIPVVVARCAFTGDGSLGVERRCRQTAASTQPQALPGPRDSSARSRRAVPG